MKNMLIKYQSIALAVIMTLSLSAISIALPTYATTASPRFSDNLMDSTIITPIWSIHFLGNGTSISPTNEGLAINFQPFSHSISKQAGPLGVPPTFGVNLLSNCFVSGNFDMQVDYMLVNWPSDNGVRLALVAASSDSTSNTFTTDATERISDHNYGGESYLTNYGDGVRGITPTTQTSGTLRMVKLGSNLTGYYLGPSGWVEIHSGPPGISTTDVRFGIAAWSHDAPTFAGRSVSILFRNLVLNSGHIVCPPVSSFSSPITSTGQATQIFGNITAANSSNITNNTSLNPLSHSIIDKNSLKQDAQK